VDRVLGESGARGRDVSSGKLPGLLDGRRRRHRSGRAPFKSEASVSCGIPGHEHPGEELVHETLKVDDDPLSFEFRGRFGFAASFD
jgi:hypothetical protein